MDPAHEQYPERLIEAISRAPVFSIYFYRIGHALIFDLREDSESEPVVVVDAMADSPYDRLLSLQRFRPTLPLPEELTLAPWTDRVQEFQESGVLDAAVERCRVCGGRELSGTAISCFRKLEALEGSVLRDMVRGIGMTTIWERGASADSE